MSELREDLLTGARVIVAPGRSVRPDTFRTDGPTLPSSVPACPFCDGNEHETPPEVERRGSGDPQTPGWRVRVVPNKYPLVGVGGVGDHQLPGAHEVVVLSPAHDRSFADLDDAAVVEVFEVLRDRIATHLADGHTHAHAFINHGKPAGASIEHPHAQVIALDFVPPFVDAMLDRFAAAQRDLLRDALDEARAEDLTITDSNAVSWCPPASEMPYAARCALPFGRQRFDIAADGELQAVALTVRDYLARLRTVLGDVPYNVTINTAPAADDRPYHWWIDILPRLTVAAGFEHATGLAVCTIAPEAAAAAIREAR
jgi:UDPglucose--hexose-1-phosphate uridylyltransferase